MTHLTDLQEVVQSQPVPLSRTNRLIGCLIGTAVGDSIGLPAENLSRQRVAKRFPGPWQHRLIGRWGMCSDDTEHAFFVAQALLATDGDAKRFARSLAWKLRWWFIALPAGVGMATAKACIRLWLGWPAAKAGVWSAGNGPVMRAPVIGAVFADKRQERQRHLKASTLLTHRDPKALWVAMAVAEVAALWSRDETDTTAALEAIRTVSDNSEWTSLTDQVARGLDAELSVDEMAERLGLSRGISGYVYHTGPMVLFAALRHGDDPVRALEDIWNCGGDVDTTGAILGGLLGIRHGRAAFPSEWVTGIHNGPLSVEVLQEAGQRLAHVSAAQPVRWPWPLVPIRNVVFLLVVLAHGFRRLVP